jgi:hypothetical protein
VPKHVATLNEYTRDCAKLLYYTGNNNNNNNNTLNLFTKHNMIQSYLIWLTLENFSAIKCTVPPSSNDIHFIANLVVITALINPKAQWSLYVPHSGHYMYRTVVTIYTAQWSLYVQQTGHYTHHQVSPSQILRFTHTVHVCVWVCVCLFV